MAKEIHALKDRNGNIFWPATASSAVVHPNTRKSLTEHITIFNLTDQNITTLSAAISKLGSGNGNYGFSNLALGSQVIIKNSSGETEEYTFYKGNTNQFTTAGNWRKTNVIIDSALGNTTNPVENQAVNSAITNINTALNNKADLVGGVLKTDQVPNISIDKLVSGSVNPTIPESLLPSYVDDVLEFASQSAFPTPGEAGKIYVDINARKTYRWGGSDYVEISASLALGTNSSTAFPGDRGLALETWRTNTVDPFITSTTNELDPSVSGSLANTVSTLNTDFGTLDNRVDALDDTTNPSSLISRVSDLESEKADNTHGNLLVNWETPTSDWTNDTATYSNLTKDTAIDKLGEILPNAVAKSVKKVTDFIKPKYIDLTLDPEYNLMDGSLATDDMWWDNVTENNYFYEFTKGYLFTVNSNNYTEDPFAVTTITSGYDSTNSTLETETRLHPNIVLRIRMKDFDTESSTYEQIQNYLFISLAATDDISYDFPGTDGTRRKYTIFSGIGAFERNVYHAFIQLEKGLSGDIYYCVLYKESNDSIQSLPVFAQDTPVYIGDTYDTAFGKLVQIINHNELTTAEALSDLDSRITGALIPITYNELKQLRNDSALSPGVFYRITDFITTTTQTGTISAGHGFDIIVQALSSNILSESAGAIQRAGDTYFSECKLSAWELKYCLDNDDSRFAWADTSNGKGVIYYMKDEFENECSYDFKNIQFQRYRVSGRSAEDPLEFFDYGSMSSFGINLVTGYDEFIYTQKYPYCFYAESLSGQGNAHSFTKTTDPASFCFTFNGISIDNLSDASTGEPTNVQPENYTYKNYDMSAQLLGNLRCRRNKISEVTNADGTGKMFLPGCVIFGEVIGVIPSDNNNTIILPLSFGGDVSDNYIAPDCRNITIGPSCQNINIGPRCHDIIIGAKNSSKITIERLCHEVAISNYILFPVNIGSESFDIYILGEISDGGFGVNLGNRGSHITVGTIGALYSALLGHFSGISIGDNCENICIDGQMIIEGGCKNIKLFSLLGLKVGINSHNIQFHEEVSNFQEGKTRGVVEILPGFNGGDINSSSDLTELDCINYVISGGNTSVQYVAKNSLGETVAWCPVDHIIPAVNG